MHVSVRDAEGHILVAQDVIVPAGESVTVRLLLPEQAAVKTMPAVKELPNTGTSGHGAGPTPSGGLPGFAFWLLGATLLGTTAIFTRRASGSRRQRVRSR